MSKVQLEIDEESGARYYRIGEGAAIGGVAETIEITNDIFCDVDANGKLLGVEILSFVANATASGSASVFQATQEGENE